MVYQNNYKLFESYGTYIKSICKCCNIGCLEKENYNSSCFWKECKYDFKVISQVWCDLYLILYDQTSAVL